MAKKQKTSLLVKMVGHDKLVALGTVFFVTSLVLLVGMFLFPAIRTLLHASALTTGLVHPVASGEPAPITGFKDVPSDHVHAKAIAFLKEHHALNGYPDGTFKPENFVTRAELLKLMFEAQKVYPSPAVYRACFKDAKDEWYAPYVCYAKAKGLVNGYGDGTYGPGNTVAAVEALKVVLMDFHVALVDASPVDGVELPADAWFRQYVWTALSRQLAVWESDVKPSAVPNLTKLTVGKALLTRGQLAEILYRLQK
ncbi:MAG: S-layer homology domain-containing protein [Candidatus Gracilibacteria bacterium]